MINYMMLDEKADPRLAKLFALGHFQSPDFPTDVKKSDLTKMKVTDKPAKEAIKSYQTFFSDDLHSLTRQFHNRLADIDGVTGPATDTLIEMPRCSVPDYGVAMEARFPESCVNKLTVSYLFDAINRDIAAKAWQHALQMWTEAIEMGFELQSSFSQGTHIWATDSALRGSILAWSMLNVGRCTSHEQRYNQLVRWVWDYLSRTQQHELGHAFGMGHQNSQSSIMYPSIRNHMKPQPMDIAYMERLGYKKRTTPLPPPDDPIPLPGQWSGSISSDDGRIVLIGVAA